ncbi:complement receptor type 2-like isoform X1 [Dreissena polymorpha]|uniref:complement receptor type 2-like isoform X1 n=1 Tax=Dreissena polymorpha TaxID=45954 RepID=UPI002263DD83|nr:complement receptor type 2-like isoform X1 [Dreissena polymorpha]
MHRFRACIAYQSYPCTKWETRQRCANGWTHNGNYNCIILDCGATPAILNGAYTPLNTTNTTYVLQANVICDAGYESNISKIICQANAKWSTANCVAKDCGTIPKILNGVYFLLNKTTTSYGSQANVTCDAGYESNVRLIMCQANATWKTAICNPKDCGTITKILNGVYYLLNKTTTSYGSQANVTCDAGYESNVRLIMCQANATWETAICNPKDCGTIPKILNGVYYLLNKTTTSYGSQANVTCDAGYESNVRLIMCQANATWETAICNPKDMDLTAIGEDDNTSDPPVAIIAGAAGGGVALIIFIVVIVVVLKMRRPQGCESTRNVHENRAFDGIASHGTDIAITEDKSTSDYSNLDDDPDMSHTYSFIH